MPKRPCPGRAVNAAFERSAQRSDSAMARSTSDRSAGSFRHSSSCMVMSAPSRCWISMLRSGVSVCLEPSICEAKTTPASSSFLILASDIT